MEVTSLGPVDVRRKREGTKPSADHPTRPCNLLFQCLGEAMYVSSHIISFLHPIRFHSINVLTCAIRLRQQRHFPCPIHAAIILSKIVQALYAVRSGPGRHAESLRLDQELDKWYFELPDHLRYDSARSKKGATPPPHVLVLHMQYWCVVLLLHRPL